MIKVATLEKYSIYEVHDEQTYFVKELEDYHPISAVIQLMKDLDVDTKGVCDDYYFLVEDSADKSHQVRAYKGWVVDFVPCSERRIVV